MDHATKTSILLPESYEIAQFLGAQLEVEGMSNSIVVAIVPQGASLGLSLAENLKLQLEVLPVREMKDPGAGTREIGVVTEHEMILSHCPFDVPQDYVYHEALRLRAEIGNEKKSYCEGTIVTSLRNKNVILVDAAVHCKGVMEACLQEVRSQSPSKIVVAAAYMPVDVERDIRALCDQLIVFEDRHWIMDPKKNLDRDVLEEVLLRDAIKVYRTLNIPDATGCPR